ncbi:hypothetical protein GGS26DRAFT_214965 [Hypomontagnella submonticulosa]|nr:hypothetical protein GGS26DRAFT_214965 [Hypomontagnella submonticulosa]
MTAVMALPALQQLQHLAPAISPAALKRRSHLGPQDSHWQPSKHDRLSQLARIHRSHLNRVVRYRKFRTSQPRWVSDDDDGRDIAADPSVVLPSDYSRSKPKLERQEAFREPKRWWSHSDIVEDDADLYAMGLLYDDDHAHGSYFNLDTIVHSEPVYSVRPAKRAKKQHQDTSYLHVDLTLSLLGSDMDVQGFLAPHLEEFVVPVEEIPIPQESPKDQTHLAPSYRDAALSTIDELPESSTHSFNARAPEASEFPDVVSDSKGEEDTLDWALVQDTDLFSIADIDEDDNDVRHDDVCSYSEDAVDAVSATGGAWIVLGDGS